MPIKFACHHCGAVTDVSEQYIGQSGPCASCGNIITIPLSPGMYAAPVTKSRAPWIIAVIVAALGVLVVGGGILVVLASLAVSNITSAQRGASLKAAESQITIFKTPLDMYRLDCGNYPSNLEALVKPPPDAPRGKWQGPYLPSGMPLDPWGNPYQYMCPGLHNPDSYDCWTISPEGIEIGNWQ